MLCPTCGNEQLLAVGPGQRGLRGLRCHVLREFPRDLYLCVCTHLPWMGPRGPGGQSTRVQPSQTSPRHLCSLLKVPPLARCRLGNRPVISAIQM